MCGIAFLMSKNNTVSLPKTIAAMAAMIDHRGPDDEGYVFFSRDFQKSVPAYGDKSAQPSLTFSSAYQPKKHYKGCLHSKYSIAMAHRRLAIVDMSPAGHQPMCSRDQHLWITFNGEIYNYIEIREELKALGAVFTSETDTEVILQAYQQWGISFISRLNGMFAFILCDMKEKKVIAVRDRFGIKPLYYWVSPEGMIALASEIKQFSVIPGWDPHLNPQTIYDFLNWGVIDHSSETCFKDVKQLRGGECLIFSTDSTPDSLQTKKWYALQPLPFQGSYADACYQFKDLLKHSIEIRAQADLKVGTLLSGGLDSSAIVSLMDQFDGKRGKQTTFSVCSTISRFDESKFIHSLTQAIDVEAFYIYPELDLLLQESADLAWHQEEPTPSGSVFAQWLVFKKIKEKNIKVVLDGQGADEYLAGYTGFFGNRLYELFKNLQWKSLYREIRLCGLLHQTLSPLSMLCSKALPHFMRQPLKKVLGRPSTNPTWLDLNFLQALDREPCQDFPERTVSGQSSRQLLHTSLPMLLHSEDRNSMAHSLESRTPFLDYRLVEFCLGLPAEYKIAEGWTKRILRESMKGIVPEMIRCRTDKMGFVTAEEEWIKQKPEFFRHSLQKAIECSNGILRPGAHKILEQMISGKRPFSHLPWRLISFGQWMDHFSCKFS